MKDFDVIVVGARCAGAPTAMLLARYGLRVLLLDRGTLGSDTLSTHYIHQIGVAKLAEWHLLDRLVATGCPAIDRIDVRAGPTSIGSLFLGFGQTGPAYCPRRTVLDSLLVDAAREAGAVFRERFRVRNLLWSDGRVCGVRGTGVSGAVEEYEARLVVGADGARSVVAAEAGAVVSRQVPLDNSYEYSYWRGVDLDGGEIFVGDRCAATAFPTHQGLTCVTAVWPAARPLTPADRRVVYSRVVSAFARLESLLRTAQRVERRRRVPRLPANRIREPVGNGWALVGDAGYHKDPITALGISDAFRDAALLADAAHRAFSLGHPGPAAFAGYVRERDDAIRSLFSFTVEVGGIVANGRAPSSSPHTRMTAGERLFLRDRPGRPEDRR